MITANAIEKYSTAARRAWRPAASAAVLLALTACAGGGQSEAPAASAAAPHVAAIQPIATLQDIMDGQVMPSADILWGATASVSDATGVHDAGPRNDDDWKKLRRGAITLIEACNLMMMDGRKVSAVELPADPTTNSLSSKDIEALLVKNRDAFNGFAQALRDVGVSMLKAIDEHKTEPLTDLGGTLDEVCEGCHKVFWYPETPKADAAPAPAKG